jgi:hypothetical protein
VRALADASGNVVFDAGDDLSEAFLGSGGNGPAVYNSAISGANDFFAFATQDDQNGTTVNFVYYLGSDTGLDFAAAFLSDTDQNLAGELSDLNSLFDATVDTIVFDEDIVDAPGIVALEGLGDGLVNLIENSLDLATLLEGIDEAFDSALGATLDLVIDTTAGLSDDPSA